MLTIWCLYIVGSMFLLHITVVERRESPPRPILFIFMQFSAKIMPNSRLAQNPLEILDPSLDTGSISPVLQQWRNNCTATVRSSCCHYVTYDRELVVASWHIALKITKQPDCTFQHQQFILNLCCTVTLLCSYREVLKLENSFTGFSDRHSTEMSTVVMQELHLLFSKYIRGMIQCRS